VAVFPDFLYDFFDYPLHKFLHSGKTNISRLCSILLAVCHWKTALQKDKLEIALCYCRVSASMQGQEWLSHIDTMHSRFLIYWSACMVIYIFHICTHDHAYSTDINHALFTHPIFPYDW